MITIVLFVFTCFSPILVSFCPLINSYVCVCFRCFKG